MSKRRPSIIGAALQDLEAEAPKSAAEEAMARIEIQQQQDSSVLEYVRERAKDRAFRDSLEHLLAGMKKKPGRKPKNLSPKAFYFLIQVIKTGYKCRTIEAALTIYCHTHGLPEEQISNLKDRYRDGRVTAIGGK